MTLLFLERIPLRDSIPGALVAPGSFPPLPNIFVEFDGLSNKFLFEPEAPRLPTIAAALYVKPSNHGCLRA